AVLWLCSPGASLVLGVARPVDGGYTARQPGPARDAAAAQERGRTPDLRAARLRGRLPLRRVSPTSVAITLQRDQSAHGAATRFAADRRHKGRSRALHNALTA